MGRGRPCRDGQGPARDSHGRRRESQPYGARRSRRHRAAARRGPADHAGVGLGLLGRPRQSAERAHLPGPALRGAQPRGRHPGQRRGQHDHPRHRPDLDPGQRRRQGRLLHRRDVRGASGGQPALLLRHRQPAGAQGPAGHPVRQEHHGRRGAAHHGPAQRRRRRLRQGARGQLSPHRHRGGGQHAHLGQGAHPGQLPHPVPGRLHQARPRQGHQQRHQRQVAPPADAAPADVEVHGGHARRVQRLQHQRAVVFVRQLQPDRFVPEELQRRSRRQHVRRLSAAEQSLSGLRRGHALHPDQRPDHRHEPGAATTTTASAAAATAAPTTTPPSRP